MPNVFDRAERFFDDRELYNVWPSSLMEKEILVTKFIVTKLEGASIRALLQVTIP